MYGMRIRSHTHCCEQVLFTTRFDQNSNKKRQNKKPMIHMQQMT